MAVVVVIKMKPTFALLLATLAASSSGELRPGQVIEHHATVCWADGATGWEWCSQTVTYQVIRSPLVPLLEDRDICVPCLRRQLYDGQGDPAGFWHNDLVLGCYITVIPTLGPGVYAVTGWWARKDGEYWLLAGNSLWEVW